MNITILNNIKKVKLTVKMPPKTTSKSKAIVANESLNEVAIATTAAATAATTIAAESVKDDVVDNTLTLNDDNSSNNGEQNEEKENEVVEHIPVEEILKLLKDRNENTRNLIKAQKSIPLYTKAELKEIQKEEKQLHKLEAQLSEERNKVLYSLASSSAPKPKKNLDSNGNKIPTPGKNPVYWYEFVKNAFGLESNNGFSSKYLELMWPFLKSEEGVKEGSSIIISRPGKVNDFFQNIKRVMEERGIHNDSQKNAPYLLIQNGVLTNTDITKFSKYCYEEKEIKPKAAKKSKA
jgi:hypothetical protein